MSPEATFQGGDTVINDNSQRQVIKRLNYGVIIRPKQEIRILTDEWSHVFVVPLPARNNFKLASLPSFDCSLIYNASLASCETLRPLFEFLKLLHDTSVNRISATIELIYIYELLHDSYITRKQRGIFDLGGQILNSLFGVATEKAVTCFESHRHPFLKHQRTCFRCLAEACQSAEQLHGDLKQTF